MAAAADANDRLLVEAVWTRWHPRFARMVEIVRGGELGELRSIESAFTFPGNFVDNYRTTPEFGGGSLLDVGPYQVHTWVALRGIDSQFNVLELDRNIGPTGIDMTTQVTGHLSNAQSARIEVRALASFERSEQQRLVVTGSLKQLECVGNEAFTSWNSASALRIGDRQEDFAPIDPFQVMLQDFGSRISGGSGWLPELSESIRVMEILDQIRLAPPGA
jgi:predicted dehydrogenase